MKNTFARSPNGLSYGFQFKIQTMQISNDNPVEWCHECDNEFSCALFFARTFKTIHQLPTFTYFTVVYKMDRFNLGACTLCIVRCTQRERVREWHMRIICANITILMVQCLATVSTPLVTKNVFAISLNAAFPFPQIAHVAVCAVRFHARVSVLEYTPALSLAQSRQSAECSNLLEIKLSILTCTSVLLAFVAHSYTYNTVVVCNYEIRRSSVFEITSNSET